MWRVGSAFPRMRGGCSYFIDSNNGGFNHAGCRTCAVKFGLASGLCPPLLRDFPGKQCITTEVKRVQTRNFAHNDSEKARFRRNRPRTKRPVRASVSRKRVFTEDGGVEWGQWPRAAVVQGDAVEHGSIADARGYTGNLRQEGARSHGTFHTKYRPKTFEEVVGQSTWSRPQARGSPEGKVSHAYLLSAARAALARPPWRASGQRPSLCQSTTTRRRSPARRHTPLVSASSLRRRAPGRA